LIRAETRHIEIAIGAKGHVTWGRQAAAARGHKGIDKGTRRPVVPQDVLAIDIRYIEIPIGPEDEAFRIREPSTARGYKGVDQGARCAIKSGDRAGRGGISHIEVVVRAEDEPGGVRDIARKDIEESPCSAIIARHSVIIGIADIQVAIEPKSSPEGKREAATAGGHKGADKGPCAAIIA
jgi:hypothetical protein